MIKDVVKNELMQEMGSGIVLVNFHATNCGPCKMLKPVLAQVHELAGSKVKIYKVDVNQDQSFTREMEIQGTPTTLFYKDNKVVDKIVGYTGVETFLDMIEKLNQ